MKIRVREIALSLVLSVAAGMPLSSQSPESKPAFEVASIRANQTGGPSYLQWPTGRFGAINQTFKALLAFAYPVGHLRSLNGEQIIGGPAWIDTDGFDIQAKPEGPARKEEMQRMLQTLLEERFQLKLHHETREFPVYDLVVVKDGPKLKLSEDQIGPGGGGLNSDSSGVMLEGFSLPMSGLIGMIEGQVGRPIQDKTNLKQRFDIELRFSPQPLEIPGPSIFTAIQQLGLKLEAAKAPLDTIVIDSVQKPSEN